MAVRLPVFVLLLIRCMMAQSTEPAYLTCPDSRYREAAIGGNTVSGVVLLYKKPLKSVTVHFYDSSGKSPWIGKTDHRGEFKTTTLPPDKYFVDVSSLGAASIELNPELDRQFRQIPSWGVFPEDNASIELDPALTPSLGFQVPAWRIFLEDNACASWMMTLN